MTTTTEALRSLLAHARKHLPLAAASWHEGEAESPHYAKCVDEVLSLIKSIDAALSAIDVAPSVEPVAHVSECEACFTPDMCQLRGTCDHYSAERLRVAKQEAAALARFGDWTMLPLIATEPMQKAMQRAVMLRKSMNDVWRAAIGEAPESPVSAPDGEPDWSDVLEQAETATGLKVERHTYSIVIREVRKWLKGAAPAAPAGWQPIETAPKDGTQIALATHKTAHAGRWQQRMYGDNWWMSGDYVAAFSTINPPTHWMPLPAAPGAPQGDAS